LSPFVKTPDQVQFDVSHTPSHVKYVFEQRRDLRLVLVRDIPHEAQNETWAMYVHVQYVVSWLDYVHVSILFRVRVGVRTISNFYVFDHLDRCYAPRMIIIKAKSSYTPMCQVLCLYDSISRAVGVLFSPDLRP
jgi:hypothetical protein